MKIILHIDMNSYFATVEQQANPKLRGKPIGVTGGDRMQRTVLGAASVEAKKFGVKTGMQIWEARKLCPQIILVQGDSDKYLECTKRFLNILKDYSPYLEVFSIDEAFIELNSKHEFRSTKQFLKFEFSNLEFVSDFEFRNSDLFAKAIIIAYEIKHRIHSEIGEWITCSIGISYNKLMAKLAGSLQKPDGLVVISNQKQAIKILDQVSLDEICGIGSRIKSRLNKMGLFNFRQLRQVPLEILFFHFKSYGRFLYNAARGVDHSPVVPFYEKQEVKSIGHRHTIDHDISDLTEIKQILLKLCEMVAVRLRAKNLLGKTIHCVYVFTPGVQPHFHSRSVNSTNDGLEIFQNAWKIFQNIWHGENIRMIGISVSNLKQETPANLTLLPDKKELINKILDKVNNKFGDFTLQRGILLHSTSMCRKPNPFLSDRRFKL